MGSAIGDHGEISDDVHFQWIFPPALVYHRRMPHEFPQVTHCLTHQLPEDQTSMIGLVCPRCKYRLYAEPPRGEYNGCWESQPVAYSLDRRPCFVYTLMWNDYRIRSLHAVESEEDARSPLRTNDSESASPN